MLRLLPLLLALQSARWPEKLHRGNDFAEIFAGEQSITKGLKAFGFTGVAVDSRMGVDYDLLRPAGLVLTLMAVMKIRRGGLLWLAPPCSSWIWMSMGSTKRTNKAVLGDQRLKSEGCRTNLSAG